MSLSDTRTSSSVTGKEVDMEIFKELWAFMRVRKKFWLAPIIVALALLGFLIFAGSAAGPLAPFVYMF